MGGGKGGSVVIGYKFFLGIHAVACHGPIDAVHRVYFGDRIAWTGFQPSFNIVNDQIQRIHVAPIVIDEPQLYGGDDLEGGISGTLLFAPGWPDAPKNSYLVSKLGNNNVSAYRGVTSFIPQQMYLGNNPFLKALTFVVSRIELNGEGTGPIWYPQKAAILDPRFIPAGDDTATTDIDLGSVIQNFMESFLRIFNRSQKYTYSADPYAPYSANSDMNPAHIIYECLTNTKWGLAQPISLLNEQSFIEAADYFHSQNFGISLKWNQESDVKEFLEVVQSHANADVYIDPFTGLWNIKVIAGDYDIETIPVVTEADIVEYEEVIRREYAECINSINIDYMDLETGDRRSLVVHNIAAIQQLGQVNATTVYFKGITRSDLALRIGIRELTALGYPLTTGRIVVRRSAGYALKQAGVFKLNAPDYNLFDEVMRITSIDYGDSRSSKVTIEFTQDVFSLDTSAFASPEMPDVPPSIIGVEPIDIRYVDEADYYSLARNLGDSIINLELNDNPYVGQLLTAGTRSVSTELGYTHRTSDDEGLTYLSRTRGSFGPGMILVDALPDNPADITVTYTDEVDLAELDNNPLPLLAAVNKEYVRVEAIDTVAKTITLKRAAVDTQPMSHPANSPLTFLQNFQNLLRDDYTSGLDILVKLQTIGITGILPLETAFTDAVSFQHRAVRPFPPQNVTINGVYNRVIADWTGSLVFAWAHRDRIQSTSVQATHYTMGSYGPEPGTYYELGIQFFDADDALIEEILPLDTTNATLTVNTADFPLPPDTAYVLLTLTSKRDGFEALYPFIARHDVP
jgi:hypothetical protein